MRVLSSFLVTMLTIIINFWRLLNILKKHSLSKTYQVLILYFHFYKNMPQKQKPTPSGSFKNIISCYALIKWMFESSKHVYGQAASPQPGLFLLTMQLCLLLVGKSHGKNEAWTLSTSIYLNIVEFIFRRHRSSRRWRCCEKKVFLKILQNLQENTYARITLSIMLQAFSLQFY